MKCRPEPSRSQKQEKKIRYAPKRGGIAYWIYIAVFAYSLPMMAVLAIAWGFIYFIPSKISVIVSLAIVFSSPLVAFFIARKGHHRLMQMPDDQYEQCFHPPCPHCSPHSTCNDDGDPFNPDSALYWTMGPGSSNYHHR